MLIYHEFMGLTYVGRSTFFVFRQGLGQRPSTHPGKGMKHQSVVRIPRRLGPSWESSFSKQSWRAHITLQYSERPFHFFFLSELDFSEHACPKNLQDLAFKFAVSRLWIINHVHAFCPMHFAFFEGYCYRCKYKGKQRMSSRQNKFAEL